MTLPDALLRLCQADRREGDVCHEEQIKDATWDRLRKWLHAGRVSAEVLTQTGYMHPVPREEWAAQRAVEALRTGCLRFRVLHGYDGFERYGRVMVRSDELDAAIAGEAEPTAPERSGPAAMPVDNSRQRGRLTKYDWDAFWCEVVRKIDLDGMPHRNQEAGWRTQADLVNHMLQWCSEHWGEEPGRTTVNTKIKKLFDICTKSQT